ncbi:hypothetical protein EVAR_77972_1 [Eumeta japonica]|uniref:Uncharacterized protein n=1 Tax=Eumeta variegata TaxID=151549 RepID=A0A4C1T2J3_EUMVA|nr:hypothetical protein EVAR_77972_1 [Eumeta japonica]
MRISVEQAIHQSRAARACCAQCRSHLPLRAKLALYKGYIRSRLTCGTSMVRTLLHITEEEDPSPAEHRPTDDRGSGSVCINDVLATSVSRP